ncbi:hypothetical protein ABGB07_42420 [Micromonosporaceae bacterium B7E4]
MSTRMLITTGRVAGRDRPPAARPAGAVLALLVVAVVLGLAGVCQTNGSGAEAVVPRSLVAGGHSEG